MYDRAMQVCFREHPDVYGEELMDDEEGGEAPDNTVGEGAVMNQQSAEPAADPPAKDHMPVKQQATKKEPQPEGQKPAEQQSESTLPPSRGLYEGKEELADETAKQSRVEAEPKDASVPPRSPTSDAPSRNA
jgi:hypothetical protein